MARSGIVLVAHARSGSNSLVEILNLALPQPMLNEPFNENFANWSTDNPNYRDRVADPKTLNDVVDEIFTQWSGLKILSYQLDLALLRHLILRPDVDVIFLRRHNLLETVVSNLIALQTNLWKTWDARGGIDHRYENLEPLAIEEVRDSIDWTRSRLDAVDAIVGERADGRAFRLVYEDLYLSGPSPQQQILDELWAHLDVPPPTSPRLSYYLNSAEVQMASESTYGRLPNLAEINRVCGSDETGWLTYL